MKQRLFVFLCAVCVAGLVLAEDMVKKIVLQQTNVSTNSAAETWITNDIPVYGELQGVMVDLSGASSPTVCVWVASVPGIGCATHRDFYSVSALTADTDVLIRKSVYAPNGGGFTNVVGCMPLSGDKIRMCAHAANKTNINVKAYIIVK